METTTQRKVMISAKDANALEAGVLAALPKIIDYARQQDYRISDDDGFLEITNSQLSQKIKDMSLKKRKVLRNYLYYLDKNPTMKMINKFLHFLMKKVLNSDKRYKILKSEKQLAIEAKRQKYYDLKAQAAAAYTDWKSEKGDFYTSRLTKGQRIE